MRVANVIAAVLWLALAGVAAAQERPVSLSRVAGRIEAGKVWMKAGAGMLCREYSETLTWDPSKKDFDVDQLRPTFHRVMQTAGVPVSGDPNNLFEEQADEGEYLIGAAITDISADVCFGNRLGLGQMDKSRGVATMTVEWQVYARLERRVVAKIVTSERFEQPQIVEGGVQKVLDGVFAANVRALAEAPAFRQAISQRSAPGPLATTGRIRLLPGKPPGGLSQIVDAVVVVRAAGHGSGFLVSTDGYILTNAHVVGGAEQVVIGWSDGSETRGRVIRSDRRRDVALIKTESKGRPALTVSPAPPQLGQAVYAIGAPLQTEFQGTVTRGIVSAPARTLDGLTYVQSDVTVNPGNSGGPLVTEGGKVVAITVAGVRPGGTPSNVNLFIPVADALRVLDLQID